MKSITNILRRSNLTSKDRILLQIHNDIKEMKTGKSSLSETDIHTLSEGWKPKDNYEVREYNKYLNIWKSLKFLSMDMQTVYLNALIDVKDVEKVLLFFLLKEQKDYRKLFADTLIGQNQEKGLTELLRNTGLDYEAVVHKMTFDSLPKNIKKDLLALDPESEHESSYFNDEENLCEILKDKKSLANTEIENVVDLIMDSVTWNFEHTFFLNERFLIRTLIHSYFAGVPMKVFIERMTKNLKITYKDEPELQKKLERITDIKTNFREAIKDEVVRGIFFSDYIPLCNSKDFATCNNINTKLPHKEVLDIWIKAKNKTRELIQEHLDKKELAIEEKCKSIFSVQRCSTIITGDSVYYCGERLSFVEEYKDQIEHMIMFGNLTYFIKQRSFIKNYQHLLAFNKILKKVSVIMEEDILFIGEKYTNEIEKEIKMLNRQVVLIADKFSDSVFIKKDVRYYTELYAGDMTVNLESLKSVKPPRQKLYEEELNTNMGEGWKNI
jgi:hypothetical protein